MKTPAGLPIIALILIAPVMGAQEELAAELILQNDEVYLGEQFPVQIRVRGSTRPREPDLGRIQGFEIRYLGGAPSSSEYVRVEDGNVVRSTARGYVFSYYFSASTTGVHVIPAIAVWADGRTTDTEPARITVIQSAVGGDFRFSVQASKSRVYTGEGFLIQVTWYLATPVRGAKFVVPFLDDRRFRFRESGPETTPRGRYAKTWINEQEVVVELGEAMLDGRPYNTVTYDVAVTPLLAGDYRIPASSVHFEALVERQRQRSLAESFFDTSAGGDYRPFVVSAGESAIGVADLPEQGRPSGFAGHVGRYSIRALVEPREATVGDPITLTVVVSGPVNVEDSPPPDLGAQRVARLFSLDTDPPRPLAASMETRTPEKRWVYTLRARSAGVSEIPPLELPHFDPTNGRYQVARSAAVPIRIVDARVVTSRDAEGRAEEPTPQATAAVEGPDMDLAPANTDASILTPQDRGLANLLHRPMALGSLLLSLAALCASVVVTVSKWLRRSRATRWGEVYRSCERALKPLAAGAETPAAILTGTLVAVTRYLSRRLGMTPGRAVSEEILSRLRAWGASVGPVTELSDVFRICEAGRYAGYPLSQQTAAEAARRALAACAGLESFFARRDTRRHMQGGLTAVVVMALAVAAPGQRASALDPAEARRILIQARELIREADELRPADPAGSRAVYLRSAELLEQLLAWRASGGLYFSLGYAYHRAGEMGRAILAYRRAELLAPLHRDLGRNLDRARSERPDGASPGRWRPLRMLGPSWARADVAALLLLAASLAAAVWLPTRRRALLRATIVAGAPALLLVASLLLSDIAPMTRREGVVTADLVVAREGDGELYRQAGEPLHQGAEFVLRDVRQDWYLVQLPGRDTCWIPASGAELILPQVAAPMSTESGDPAKDRVRRLART